jgi:hypothetical protein
MVSLPAMAESQFVHQFGVGEWNMGECRTGDEQ